MFNNPLYRRVRDDIIEFCKEKGVEVRKGEYQVGLRECERYLAKKYELPERFVTVLLANMSLGDTISTGYRASKKKWYIFIGEMMCLSSRRVVESEEDEKAAEDAAGKEE
ncbi:hypothetical protein KJ885_04130 [Patescibacteria group bacterium]|nr:hypothetical protein [Patescibacteria group bacterium]